MKIIYLEMATSFLVFIWCMLTVSNIGGAQAKTDHRIVQMRKPKPKIKKTEISVRFGVVRFGFRFSV
jgi:hypothetical protein